MNWGSFTVSMIFKEILLVEITKRVSVDRDQLKGLSIVSEFSFNVLSSKFSNNSVIHGLLVLSSPLSGETEPAYR